MGDEESASETVTNIVLVGRTGNGKSATGNSLLGKKSFISKSHAAGVTMKCEMYRGAIKDGPIINVIDTPGLFDLSVSAEYISKEIINCLTMAEEGIHAVLYVLSIRNRVTEEEEQTLNILQSIFESKIVDYLIVVFTGGDELEYNNETLEDYLHEGSPAFLTEVLRICGKRKVVFDNRTQDQGKKDKQVKELMGLVAKVLDKNGGKPYTDKMHGQIKEEGERLRKEKADVESKNLSKNEAATMISKLQETYEWKLREMEIKLQEAMQQPRKRFHGVGVKVGCSIM